MYNVPFLQYLSIPIIIILLFFIIILFKQYLFLTFVPKARGLSRELMLQKIQRFFRTSVRHKHTVRKEKNKTITTSENNRHSQIM